MFIAGLTGGAGCGKSTFRENFCHHTGALSLDADQIVRSLLETDPEVREAIVCQLSPLAYHSDNRPNRKWLRDLIFNSPQNRNTLENILHPRVRDYWLAAVSEAKDNRQSLVVEIPLLFEKNLETEFDCSILVAAAPQTQLKRLTQRGLAPSLAERMLNTQLTNEEKLPRATHVIWNDGAPEFLTAQSHRLADQFSHIYGN